MAFLCSRGWLWLAPLLTQLNSAVAAPGDKHWDRQFGWPGVSNDVYAIAVCNGRIYVGGGFTEGSKASGVQVWDGMQWSRIGQLIGNWPGVYDIACVGNLVYVGGSFTNIDGVSVSGLARWDGRSWTSVGLGGVAYALAAEGANLYVGGSFTNAGGVRTMNIGRWDGNSWYPLGDGLGSPGAYAPVRALAVTNGMVYAAGSFSRSGTTAVTNIAFWNGEEWTPLGAGLTGGSVLTLKLVGRHLYAGGAFTTSGSTVLNRIARWDGQTWISLGTWVDATVRAIGILGDRLCVGVEVSITPSPFREWDGTSWRAADNRLDRYASVNRLVSTGTNVFVGGDFITAGGVIANHIASWDGTNWSTIGPAGRTNGVSSSVRSFGSDGSNVYIGGSFSFAGQIAARAIARFDGANWQALGSGMNGAVYAVAVVGSDIYAGGAFTNAGGVAANHIARWDGTNWFAVGDGIAGSIRALAVRGNDLYVAGNFQLNTGDAIADSLVRWDGSNWWSVLRFAPGTSLHIATNDVGFAAIAFHNHEIYVGGRFSLREADGSQCDNIMRFDGAYCRSLGSGLNSNINSIAVVDGNVYAGGAFTQAGGRPASYVAKWDGSAWAEVGGGVSGSVVHSLATIGNVLYAAGFFTNAGGVAVNNIAAWDGVTWSALGSGVTATVITLGAFGDDLYVGHSSRQAGGKPSHFIARWNKMRNFEVPTIRLSAVSAVGDVFTFGIGAVDVPAYVIEATTNFSDWAPLETNSRTFSEFRTSTPPNDPQRYYRARAQP